MKNVDKWIICVDQLWKWVECQSRILRKVEKREQWKHLTSHKITK